MHAVQVSTVNSCSKAQFSLQPLPSGAALLPCWHWGEGCHRTERREKLARSEGSLWWPTGKRSPGDGGGDVVVSGIIQGLWPDGGIGGGWVALGPGWSRTASSVIHRLGPNIPKLEGVALLVTDPTQPWSGDLTVIWWKCFLLGDASAST